MKIFFIEKMPALSEQAIRDAKESISQVKYQHDLEAILHGLANYVSTLHNKTTPSSLPIIYKQMLDKIYSSPQLTNEMPVPKRIQELRKE